MSASRRYEPIDETDRRILNALQDGFPVAPRPFAEAAAPLGLSEDALIARIGSLLERRIATRFGPFYDVAAMGGVFWLCAMAAPAERFETVAEQVNARREVAHNYERAHRLNMWFVLAADSEDAIEAAASAIEAETELTVLRFPKLEEFFVGFKVAA